MAQVNIVVNGQNYTVTCDDGQEARLQELAEHFDRHVTRLSQQVGRIADSRLMLLAGLTVCDELRDAQTRLTRMEDQTGLTSEAEAAQSFASATAKVRDVARRLEETG